MLVLFEPAREVDGWEERHNYMGFGSSDDPLKPPGVI